MPRSRSRPDSRASGSSLGSASIWPASSRKGRSAGRTSTARADRVVAAHCHGKPGIMAALRVGCRTIEHGTFLDEEAADLMLQRDAILVPTRFIIDRLVRFGKEAGIADYAYRKAVAVNEQH